MRQCSPNFCLLLQSVWTWNNRQPWSTGASWQSCRLLGKLFGGACSTLDWKKIGVRTFSLCRGWQTVVACWTRGWCKPLSHFIKCTPDESPQKLTEKPRFFWKKSWHTKSDEEFWWREDEIFPKTLLVVTYATRPGARPKLRRTFLRAMSCTVQIAWTEHAAACSLKVFFLTP